MKKSGSISRIKGKRHQLKKSRRKRVVVVTPRWSVIAQKDTTIGVRYAQGPALNRVFTYRVRCPHPFKLGDPVVADAAGGMQLAFIVRIDAKPDTSYPGPLKWLRHRVVELHERVDEADDPYLNGRGEEWSGDDETPSCGPP
jgi:hypothetical protein